MARGPPKLDPRSSDQDYLPTDRIHVLVLDATERTCAETWACYNSIHFFGSRTAGREYLGTAFSHLLDVLHRAANDVAALCKEAR